MHQTLLRHAGVAVLSSMCLGLPGPVHAQTSSSSDSTAQSTEIIVTALKRSERLSDVPMSITAATGDQLKQLGVESPDDLGKIVTGLVYSKSAYGAPVYTLRGVGFYDYSLAAIPAVTIYVDEVPLPYSKMGMFANLDLERVEVLKGPQGTLYGQNSTGGAINYIAAKPTSNFAAGMDASYGRFNEVNLSGFVSGPITDTLKVRVAASHLGGGDWQYSSSRSDTLGRKNVNSARILLDWQATPDLSFHLNANWGRDTSDTQAGQYEGITPANPTASTVKASRPNLFNYPHSPNNPRAADWDAGVPLNRDDRQGQVALTGRWALSPKIELTSISSYVKLKTNSELDADGTPFVDFYGTTDGSARSLYQELRLNGQSGPLQWIVGANYADQKVNELQYGTYYDDYLGIIGITKNINGGDQRDKSKAAYSDFTLAITPTVNIDAGARYTDETHSFAGCTRTGDAATAAYYTGRYKTPVAVGDCITILPVSGFGLYITSFDEHSVSWRGGINWKPETGVMLYTNVSRGYKGGSYPLSGGSNYYQLRPVPQESLTSYEAGLKTNLLAGLLQVNAAGFYYDYHDKQIRGKAIQPETGAVVAALVTVPKSSITGAELQAILRPARGLSLEADAAYTKSKIIGSFTNYDFFGFLQDFKGQTLPYTPAWTVSGQASYDFPVTGDWFATLGGNAHYQSESKANLGTQAAARLNSYATLDLRASLTTNDHRLSFSIWGRNVTNTYYWNNVLVVLAAVARYASPPATYGVSASYRF
ncbi:MAG TPA: TonB-dependent receptor [Sphingomonas sp.]|uniref:TonB-dependent receptor n=1 Tax=Sphingomonas sp. TaxID=28214 RepID=UPI002BFAA229|nr:TonB-dependent receptor [Sphingomonas sp.]HMI17980.1 TonB-dependent receptor [Sphingomonas sp.]